MDQTLITQIEDVVRVLFEEEQQVQVWLDTPVPQLGSSPPRTLMQQPDSIKNLHAYVMGLADAAVKGRSQEICQLLSKSELTSSELWKMKQLKQKNDRLMVVNGKLSAEDVLFIRPDKMRGAKVRWPDGDVEL